MQFDTSWLTRGKYIVYLVLFEMNEFGTCMDHDLVLPAFSFEIEDDNTIVWNLSAWGHIRLPDIQLF